MSWRSKMAATAAAVVAEEDTELRDLLVQTLENSGVLNRIKVRPEAGAGSGGSARPAWTAVVTTVAARRPPPWRGTGTGGHWGRAPAGPPSCQPHSGGRLVRSFVWSRRAPRTGGAWSIPGCVPWGRDRGAWGPHGRPATRPWSAAPASLPQTQA